MIASFLDSVVPSGRGKLVRGCCQSPCFLHPCVWEKACVARILCDGLQSFISLITRQSLPLNFVWMNISGFNLTCGGSIIIKYWEFNFGLIKFWEMGTNNEVLRYCGMVIDSNDVCKVSLWIMMYRGDSLDDRIINYRENKLVVMVILRLISLPHAGS